MSRTQEVVAAMETAAASLHPRLHRYTEYHAAVTVLAAEVERLESCLTHMTAWHELARARAEAAEARVAELIETDEAEAQIASEEIARLKARVAKLEAQLQFFKALL